MDLNNAPTGNLDMKSSLEIMKLLKRCNKNGRTIIMVTHNNSLLKYATRVIKIAHGKVISDEKKTNNWKH